MTLLVSSDSPRCSCQHLIQDFYRFFYYFHSFFLMHSSAGLLRPNGADGQGRAVRQEGHGCRVEAPCKAPGPGSNGGGPERPETQAAELTPQRGSDLNIKDKGRRIYRHSA